MYLYTPAQIPEFTVGYFVRVSGGRGGMGGVGGGGVGGGERTVSWTIINGVERTCVMNQTIFFAGIYRIL
jgi:hypothetical protein